MRNDMEPMLFWAPESRFHSAWSWTWHLMSSPFSSFAIFNFCHFQVLQFSSFSISAYHKYKFQLPLLFQVILHQGIGEKLFVMKHIYSFFFSLFLTSFYLFLFLFFSFLFFFFFSFLPLLISVCKVKTLRLEAFEEE